MPTQNIAFICIAVLLFFYQARASQGPVNQQCMGCICEAVSGCNVTAFCYGDVCGPFGIPWAYWVDAGKPTLNGDDPESPGAYMNCANNVYCAATAVQGYMEKFQKDCNSDGKIDCDDFALIHRLGGYGCTGKVDQIYGDRYRQCKRIVGSLDKGKPLE